MLALPQQLAPTVSHPQTEKRDRAIPAKTLGSQRNRGYQPLDPNGREIRVVQIFPEPSKKQNSILSCVKCYTKVIAFNERIESFNPYRALSYTWGDPDNLISILLDDQAVQVTENLAVALQHLSKSHPGVRFWIDAICIDQTNETEKSKQVEIMGAIFKRAIEVIVWVGPSEEGSSEAIMVLKQIGEAYQKVRQPYGKVLLGKKTAQSATMIDEDECKVLDSIGSKWFSEGVPVFNPIHISRIFQRPWFRRVWVLQEAAVNAHVTFHCGGDTIPKSVLWAGSRAIIALTNDACNQTSSWVADDPLWQTLSGANFISRRTMDLVRKNVGDYTLEQLLLETSANLGEWTYEASDARDRVYAIMGLSSDLSTVGINPNYDRSCEEVYIDVAERILRKSGTVDILYAVTWPKKFQSMPYWVPDWSTSMPACFGLRQIGRFHASGKASRATPVFTSDRYGKRILSLRGYEVGRVKKIFSRRYCPSTGTGSARDTAVREIVELIRELALVETTAYPTLESRNEALWRTPIADCDAVFNIKHRHRPAATVRMKESYDTLLTLSHSDACDDLRVRAYLHVMKLVSARRQLFVSDSGYLGLGADTMRNGDLVCLLLGGDSPLILRQTNSGDCELVGEAYVHGIMHGEFLSNGLPSHDFRLC